MRSRPFIPAQNRALPTTSQVSHVACSSRDTTSTPKGKCSTGNTFGLARSQRSAHKPSPAFPSHHPSFSSRRCISLTIFNRDSGPSHFANYTAFIASFYAPSGRTVLCLTPPVRNAALPCGHHGPAALPGAPCAHVQIGLEALAGTYLVVAQRPQPQTYLAVLPTPFAFFVSDLCRWITLVCFVTGPVRVPGSRQQLGVDVFEDDLRRKIVLDSIVFEYIATETWR